MPLFAKRFSLLFLTAMNESGYPTLSIAYWLYMTDLLFVLTVPCYTMYAMFLYISLYTRFSVATKVAVDATIFNQILWKWSFFSLSSIIDKILWISWVTRSYEVNLWHVIPKNFHLNIVNIYTHRWNYIQSYKINPLIYIAQYKRTLGIKQI